MPTALRKARGRVRGGPKKGSKEPTPKAGTPDMPLHIRKDKDAMACWTSLASTLRKLKVLTKADGAAFEGMCQAYSRAVQADRLIRKHGMVKENIYGDLKANPAVNISRASWAELRKFAQEFGLTPSARTRVSEMQNDEGSPKTGEGNAEDFLFGGGHGKVVGRIGR